MTGTPPIITMDDGQRNKNVIKSKNGLMKFLFKIFTENQNLKISKSKFLIYQKIMMILTIFQQKVFLDFKILQKAQEMKLFKMRLIQY